MSTIEYQYQVLNITAVIGITALRSKFSETSPFDKKSDWLVVTGNQ